MSLPVYKLIPAGKDYLWGGTRLNSEFGKNFGTQVIAESWECSTHPDGMSRIAAQEESCGSVTKTPGAASVCAAEEESCRLADPGTESFPCMEEATQADSGTTLRELLLAHPEYLGTHPAQSMPEAAKRGEIPILIKFIDAAKDLSVQVHPDDDYAREHENGQLGKTEMWYVLDAEPGAELIYGFRRDLEPEQVHAALKADQLGNLLQRVPVQRDDVYFVRAGTVHAIGAGCLIVEVQESSNLTYRLCDYHRKGADGRERELHIDKALAVMNCRASTSPRQPLRVLRYRPGCASELLCRCRYFEVHRLLINTRGREKIPPCGQTDPASVPCPEPMHSVNSVNYRTDTTSFHVLVCIEGDGVIWYTDMERGRESALPYKRGDTLFVPADTRGLHITGKAAFLDVNC